MTQQYEFRLFGPDAAGPETVEYHSLRSDASAKSKAGRLAKRTDGPVDLARAGAADWNDRYMTTAAPSEYHAAGFRFERLT